MNRSELVEEMASQFGQLSHQDIVLAIDTLFAAMTRSLAGDGRIEIRGFGSLSVSRQAARIGRNPRTGQQVDIPARRAFRFKPGKALRENVNIGWNKGSL